VAEMNSAVGVGQGRGDQNAAGLTHGWIGLQMIVQAGDYSVYHWQRETREDGLYP
jgi:hypothetical protein